MRSIVISAATVLAALATPAHAALEKIGDDGFVTRHTEVVDAEPMAIWAELVEPAGWWNGAHSFSGDAENLTLDPRAGGCFCEMLPAGDSRPEPGSVRHMEVLFVDPGTAMRLSGALGPLQSEAVNGVLTITMKQVDGGTRVLFEYVVGGTMRFPVDQIGPAVDRVIGEQLSRLADKIGRTADSPAPEVIDLPPSAAAEAEAEEVAMEEAAAAVEEEGFGADFLSDLDAEPEAREELSPVGNEELDEFDTR
ncbi:SRPBCC family protein [Croceicoccus sediminis]|uniref:SRPBCC family protein n=1 Tax=Croceicoccus sediminis TaxID=2571150 RepID=UPI001182683F|nr:SRPBCC family protein [Croceicoccus sediminis]